MVDYPSLVFGVTSLSASSILYYKYRFPEKKRGRSKIFVSHLVSVSNSQNKGFLILQP